MDDLTKTLQCIEFNMLVELKALFDQYDIPFCLACGTLLGCVRNNGFIPWDDDIDIYIRGCDYEKVKRVFKEYETGNLVLHDYDLVENYPYTFPKIVHRNTVLVENSLKNVNYKCGVYIDLFLLEDSPNNKFLRYAYEKQRYLNYCIIRFYYTEFDSKARKLVSSIVQKMFNPVKVQRMLRKMYTRSFNSNYYIDVGTFKQQALLPKRMFECIIQRRFESVNMPIPKQYSKYLEHYYGNFMQLPSVENRVSVHDFYFIDTYKQEDVNK